MPWITSTPASPPTATVGTSGRTTFALPVAIPHMRLPMQVFAGEFQTVEQDTTDEIMQCARAVVGTVRGQREELPEFGLDVDLTFLIKDIDVTRVEAALAEWEPRAAATIETAPQSLDALLTTLRILVEEGEGEGV